MRNYWHAGAAALCLATGCAGAFGSGADGAKLTASGRPESFKAPQVQQASWTEWITSPFGGGPTPAEKLQRDAIAASQAAEMRNAQFHAFSPGQPTPPPSPALLASMAELHVRNGRIPEARQLFQRALAADPHNVPILLSAARMEDREGRLDVATALYQRAATIQPNNATVANDLGLCLARRGQLAEAENALLRAVQLNPAKPLYRNNLAKVYVEQNRLDAAATHLAAAYPPPVVNYNLGVLLYERGRLAEADRCLAAALQADPQMGPAQALLAEVRANHPVYQASRPVPPTTAGPAYVDAPNDASADAEMPALDGTPVLLPPIY